MKPALRKLLAVQPAGNSDFTLSDVSRRCKRPSPVRPRRPETLEFKDGARVGPYELMRELGRGGMGTVWLARRTEGLTRRVVALKLPHPGIAARGVRGTHGSASATFSKASRIRTSRGCTTQA